MREKERERERERERDKEQERMVSWRWDRKAKVRQTYRTERKRKTRKVFQKKDEDCCCGTKTNKKKNAKQAQKQLPCSLILIHGHVHKNNTRACAQNEVSHAYSMYRSHVSLTTWPQCRLCRDWKVQSEAAPAHSDVIKMAAPERVHRTEV